MFQEMSPSILRGKAFHYFIFANGREVVSDSAFHDDETVLAETQRTRSKNNDTLEKINKGMLS